VGFHGKDVDHIIKDLVDISINMTKKRIKEEIRATVEKAVENRIIDALIGIHASPRDREEMRLNLRTMTEMEDRVVDIDIASKGDRIGSIAVDGSQGLVDFSKLMSMNPQGKKRSERKRMTVRDARAILEETESEKLLENYDVVKEAIAAVEESGIVFIDEIDKLVSSGDYRGADASSEGVQRDLLPIIEGNFPSILFFYYATFVPYGTHMNTCVYIFMFII
jgi:ATP-dependent HslUV protease ATP-binding subunit HslU